MNIRTLDDAKKGSMNLTKIRRRVVQAVPQKKRQLSHTQVVRAVVWRC
jgi:Fe2+ or Zn2+ uptake regulation protein